MKQSPRSQKLAGVLEPEIGRLINRFFTPDQIGFVTVSAVEVSGDLKVVDVFVRSLNGPQNFCKKLNRSHKRFSHALAQKLEVRQALIIRFKEDKAVKQVERVESLMKKDFGV